jgi:hypothetical protein
MVKDDVELDPPGPVAVTIVGTADNEPITENVALAEVLD